MTLFQAVLISESGDKQEVEGQHQVSLEELGTTVTFPPVVKVMQPSYPHLSVSIV